MRHMQTLPHLERLLTLSARKLAARDFNENRKRSSSIQLYIDLNVGQISLKAQWLIAKNMLKCSKVGETHSMMNPRIKSKAKQVENLFRNGIVQLGRLRSSVS